MTAMATHEVLNQPPPLEQYDVFAADEALAEGVAREGAAWAITELHELGRLAGSPTSISWGEQANANPPVLRTHDRFGHRLDVVDYHPAYHELMNVAVAHGLHAAPWAEPRLGVHVARAAKFFVWSQVDAGHGCPISMTYSVVPALRRQPELTGIWEPHLVSRQYDPANRPVAEKAGALAGMAMTEKQGGSDVRANTTRAEPGTGGEYRLTGHKWFCSAPMCDVFLVLAQAPRGLTCFAVPRWRPDGTRNPMLLQRLKDKLGNRSNASSEVEFDATSGWIVGEEGRGVATIINMVNHTRLDCTIGAAAGMRQALSQAVHHAVHRRAFGRDLIDQPLMTNVLADLAVESEAATLTMLRLARAYDDAADGDEEQAVFRRLATAVAKYWLCKRHPAFVAEAVECLGGAGYVEESIMPRLFRESPLNGIWEGSGNVICLDVLRAVLRQPESVDAFRAELATATGADARYDQWLAVVDRELADLEEAERRARRIVEVLAVAWQGSLLLRYGHPSVADAFCASRLGATGSAGGSGWAFGTLPAGVDAGRIVERARPKVA